jgi:hypothetical protein
MDFFLEINAMTHLCGLTGARIRARARALEVCHVCQCVMAMILKGFFMTHLKIEVCHGVSCRGLA